VRILHVISGLRVGGAERMLIRVAKGLARDAEQVVVTLVDGATRDRLDDMNIPVVRPERAGLAGIASVLARAHRLVREFQPDIIQGWMYHGNLVAELLRTVSGPRALCIWNIRQSLESLWDEKLTTRLAIRSCSLRAAAVDGIVYNSKRGAEQHDAAGFRAATVRIIPNGFEPEEFERSSGADRRLRDRTGVPTDAPIVGCVARYHPMKDHATFIAAASQVREKVPDVHFVLLGSGTDTPGTELERMIEEHFLSARVHRLGVTMDPKAVMSGFDVLCLSSAWGEGFPNVLGEALALGIPCVTTDVGDSREVVGPGGSITPPRNSEALASAIVRLLSFSAAERKVVGELGRNHVQGCFAIETVVRQYEEFYDELLATVRRS
jgi:glycosyltransferase involved in cell wall biosynthesis